MIKGSKEHIEYLKYLTKMCVLRNCISLICFTILAIFFNNFWIVLLTFLFLSEIGKESEDKQ